MKILLIALGNPLRGDDGAGPYVAQRLRVDEHVQVITTHQLTPELADTISRAGYVIFVDAHGGLPPGQIAIEPVQARDTALLHQLDPGTLLSLARELYGRAPEAVIVGIGGESYDLGEGLSPGAKRAARESLRALRDLVTQPGVQQPG